MTATLATGEVHVYHRLTDTLGETDIADAASVLSPDEQQQYRRFLFARDRRDYAAAHALLRRSLSRYAAVVPSAWQFVDEAHGKPRLVAGRGVPPLSFNLSHTHGLVACAVAGGADVGIDVESVDRDISDGVAHRFFSPRENEDLDRCPSAPVRARRFFELWTLKEAYIKAIGKGLSHPLDTIVFTVDDDRTVTFTPPLDIDSADWHFRLFAPTDRHRLAVAIRRPPGETTSITLMPS